MLYVKKNKDIRFRMKSSKLKVAAATRPGCKPASSLSASKPPAPDNLRISNSLLEESSNCLRNCTATAPRFLTTSSQCDSPHRRCPAPAFVRCSEGGLVCLALWSLLSEDLCFDPELTVDERQELGQARNWSTNFARVHRLVFKPHFMPLCVGWSLSPIMT